MKNDNSVAYQKLQIRLIFSLFFALFTLSAFAQSSGYPNCGIYIRDQDSLPPFEEIAYDRFGNWYTKEELETTWNESSLPLGCPSQDGFFLLAFNGGFSTDEEHTICAVFSYLEEVIIPTSSSINVVPVRVQLIKEGFIIDNPDGTESPDVNTLATGSPLFLSGDCGIGDNNVWNRINNDLNFLSIGPDAEIRVNSNISNFHYMINDPPDLSTGIGANYDMFTVILHEALHTIGFASKIGATGNTLYGNWYSRWDKHLYGKMDNNPSPTLQPLIIPDASPIACCDDHEFNAGFFPSMPDDVTHDCDNNITFPQIVFSTENIAPVNAQYNIDLSQLPPNQQHDWVANILSHLNGNCTGIDYVMHFEFDENELRRDISDEELDILCTLGYTINPDAYSGSNNSCEPPCIISLLSDGKSYTPPFFYIPLNEPFGLPYTAILANDVVPDLQEITVSLSPYCNISNEITVTESTIDDEFIITGSAPGIYKFCYEVTGCGGNWCDSEEIWILVLPHGLASGCNNNENCDELVCWGDFEGFSPISSSYFGQLGIPGFIFQPFNHNTPDIVFTDSGNNLLGANSITASSYETIYIPLGAPVEDGCELNISFKAIAKQSQITVTFFASENEPCSLPEIPDCLNPGVNNCQGSNYTTFCMEYSQFPTGEIPLPFNSGLTSDFVTFGDPDYPFSFDLGGTTMYFDADLTGIGQFDLTWENNTGSTINYITLVHKSNNPFFNSGTILFDDFHITNSCYTPDINADFTYDDNLCTTTIQFTSSPTEGDHEWDFDNDGSSDSPLENPTWDFGTPGDYPVTHTVSNDCGTDEVTEVVTVTYLEAPDASFTHDAECSTVVQFSSVATQGDHEWDFNEDGNSDSSLENPTWDFGAPGDYSVTHTVTNDCGTDEVTEVVTVISELPDASFTYDAECITLVQFTSVTTQGDHQWDFDEDGNSDSSLENPTWDFGGEGTYTVTHTVTNACGSSTEIIQITIDLSDCVDEFCECIDGSVISGSPTNITTEFPGESNISNTCVSISGILIIDESFTFDNCFIFMHPGAEIIVSSSKNLFILNSNINGCGEQLWKSITVQNGAYLEIEESFIRDGREAIQALDQSKIHISGSLFDKNYISIYVPSTQAGSNISSFIFQNTFSCSANLLDNFESTQLGSTSLAGVWMYKTVGLNIGLPNDPNNINTFTGLRNGIFAFSSVVNVHHVVMQNLVGGPFQLSNFSGVGVYTNDCQLSLSQSSFNEVYSAVFSEATNVNQLDACSIGQLGNVHTGIYIQSGFYHTNNITNNIIYCNNVGITIGNLASSNLKVTGNQVTTGLGASTGTGVLVYNAHFNDPGDVLFSDNTISLHNAVYGFHVYNSTNLRINDNTITELAPFILFPDINSGIDLSAAKNCQVRDNTITGTGSDSELTGIQVSNSQGTVFCCNTIDATRRGVSFVGACDDTNLRATDVSTVITSGLGLHLSATATIGDQISDDGFLLYGNIFSDSEGIVNSGATHEGTSIPDVNSSRIFIDPVGHPETVPFPINAIPGSSWFPQDETGVTLTCAQSPNCNIQGLLPPGGTDSNDVKTSEGGRNFGAFTDGLQWEASRYLYWKLKNYTALHSQHNSVDSFYTANQSTVLGAMYEIEEDILDLFQPDAALRQGLAESLDEIEALLPLIAFQDSLLMTTADTLHDPIMIAKDSLLQSLHGYHQSAQIFRDSILQERITAAATVKSANLSVLASADFELNLKKVNDIYLSTIAVGVNEPAPDGSWSGRFNSSQLAQIEIIAGKCPLSDGNAVYFARGLLAMVKDTIFDDAGICNAGQGQRQAGQGDETNPVKLYPNPASGQITLEFEENIESEHELTIYSVTGQQYASYKLTEDQKSFLIDISIIPSGLYFYKISRKGHSLQNGKLIIVKL